MSNEISVHSLQKAKKFLEHDVIKVFKRTKYLYLDVKPKTNIGRGYFEPILLCLCWCDYLGALYVGDYRIGEKNWKYGNTKRTKAYIRYILGCVNPDYQEVYKSLVDIYRHGLVHAYAPRKFHIRISRTKQHLTVMNDRLVISLECFLDEMIKGVRCFASILKEDNNAGVGTLAAFNRARKELAQY
jgi:hypothetical protein